MNIEKEFLAEECGVEIGGEDLAIPNHQLKQINMKKGYVQFYYRFFGLIPLTCCLTIQTGKPWLAKKWGIVKRNGGLTFLFWPFIYLYFDKCPYTRWNENRRGCKRYGWWFILTGKTKDKECNCMYCD